MDNLCNIGSVRTIMNDDKEIDGVEVSAGKPWWSV